MLINEGFRGDFNKGNLRIVRVPDTPYSPFIPEIDDVRRGEVYWAKLEDLSIGNSFIQKKNRPVVILQNDVGNARSGCVIVAIFTTAEKKKRYPMHLYLELDNIEQTICLEQIFTLDKERLINKKGEIPLHLLPELDERLCYSLGLDTFSLRNITDFVVHNRLHEKTITREVCSFTIRLSYASSISYNRQIDLLVSLDDLKTYDDTIDQDINFDELKNKLDCCKGLNWLVNNGIQKHA